MLNWKETKHPALRTEEAALLPAMTRSLDAGEALKTVLRSAEKMKGKNVAEAIPAAEEKKKALHAAASPARSGPRAALYQVWKKR